jgi:hypothetical protein
VLGVLVLQETLTLAMGAGFALVIVGSALATRPSGRSRPPRSAGLRTEVVTELAPASEVDLPAR